MPPTPQDLEKLREAVMLASDPHPEHHLAALLIMSVWERNDDPTDATSDFLISPTEHSNQMIRNIGIMAREMGLI